MNMRHVFGETCLFAIQSGELSVMSKNKYAAKREFYKTIQDLAEHPVVLEMKKYPQHGKTNCYKHCLRVAYCNYCLCKMFHLDARSAARQV